MLFDIVSFSLLVNKLSPKVSSYKSWEEREYIMLCGRDAASQNMQNLSM